MKCYVANAFTNTGVLLFYSTIVGTKDLHSIFWPYSDPYWSFFVPGTYPFQC